MPRRALRLAIPASCSGQPSPWRRPSSCSVRKRPPRRARPRRSGTEAGTRVTRQPTLPAQGVSDYIDRRYSPSPVQIMGSRRRPESFLPLPVSEFEILLALADGERHGYSIMTDVTERTRGSVRLGPGTLYGSVKRMLASGLIDESAAKRRGEDEDERRRYYRLTALGRAVAAAEAARLEELVRQARRKRLLPAMETP